MPLRLVPFLTVLFATTWFSSAASAQEAKPLRVCLVSGSIEYESNKTLPVLQKHLESTGRVVCSRAFLVGKEEAKLPGLENLDSCDVMVLFTRRLKLTGEDLERIKKYCQAGKPIVGIRTASHAVQTWLALDKEILGGNYTGHFGEIPTTVKIADKAKDHPILAGFTPFVSEGSLYKNNDIAADTEVLLTGSIPASTMPIAWTRIHNGGRIFYTSLGHQKDFDNPNFLRLLDNAISWTAGRTAKR